MQDDFETRLKALSPANAKVDPLAAAYDAGRQSANRALNGWRSVAVLAVIVALIPWMLPRQKQPDVIAPQVVMLHTPASEEIEIPPAGNMLQLRAAVLERGMDGLPRTQLPPTPADRGYETF